MKMKHMSRYYIRLLLILLISGPLFAQDNENELPQDSTAFKEKYGLRLGIDLSRLGRTFSIQTIRVLKLMRIIALQNAFMWLVN